MEGVQSKPWTLSIWNNLPLAELFTFHLLSFGFNINYLTVSMYTVFVRGANRCPGITTRVMAENPDNMKTFLYYFPTYNHRDCYFSMVLEIGNVERDFMCSRNIYSNWKSVRFSRYRIICKCRYRDQTNPKLGWWALELIVKFCCTGICVEPFIHEWI